MKKFVLILMLCMSVFSLTGCGSEEEKTMNCSRTLNQNGIEMDLSYTVNYKGDYVTSVKSVEKIKSDDATTIETYKTQLEQTISPYKDIKYYDHEVNIDGNTLTSTITINYEKIDTDKFISVDSSAKQLIKDGKVEVETLETLYNTLGITCEK